MAKLIEADEGPVTEIRLGNGPLVVVCEHASNRLPRSLGTLGLQPSDLDRHIAWDPGAAQLVDGIAKHFDATLVAQRYSRLVIDCNRDPRLPDAIAATSEDTSIPGNENLPAEGRSTRISEVWQPFHDAVAGVIDERMSARQSTALVTVHTFTPVYRGVRRPWDVGIISTDDRRFADVALAVLRRNRALVVGDNEPYSSKDNVTYTIQRHGRDRGLPHVMIEVRNDLVADATGQALWSERLAMALAAFDVAARAA